MHLLQYFVDFKFLLLHRHRLFGNFLLDLLLLLGFLDLLFLLFLSVAFWFLFEREFNLDPIVFCEIARHGDFNNGWIVFKIKEELV